MTPSPKLRVVVLMTSGEAITQFGAQVVRSVATSERLDVPAIFVTDEGERPFRKPLGDRIRRNLRRKGSLTAVTAAYYVASKVTGRRLDWNYVSPTEAVDLESFYRGDVHRVAKLHAPEVAERLRSYHPDVCFHVGHLILREPILSIPRLGVMGYHHGDLTRHRGSLPCFWEIYNGESETAVTTQILSAGLDTGRIVRQRFFPIGEDDTLKTLQQRVHEETVDMAVESLVALADPSFSPREPHVLGEYHSSPTLAQWLRLHARLAVRGLASVRRRRRLTRRTPG